MQFRVSCRCLYYPVSLFAGRRGGRRRCSSYLLFLLHLETSLLHDRYEGCMEVTESDHKPVRCKFNIELAHIDRSVRRQEFGKVFQNNDRIRSVLNELRYVPETNISTSQIVLQNKDTFSLQISNKSREDMVLFQITCSGQSTTKEDTQASEYHPRGSLGFPRWLEVILHFLDAFSSYGNKENKSLFSWWNSFTSFRVPHSMLGSSKVT